MHVKAFSLKSVASWILKSLKLSNPRENSCSVINLLHADPVVLFLFIKFPWRQMIYRMFETGN